MTARALAIAVILAGCGGGGGGDAAAPPKPAPPRPPVTRADAAEGPTPTPGDAAPPVPAVRDAAPAAAAPGDAASAAPRDAAPAPPIAKRCVGVGDRARGAYLDQAKAAPTDVIRRFNEHLADVAPGVLERHCTDDGWTAQAIACAKRGAQNCDKTLTAAQLDKLQNDKLLNP